jgi:hypothetical protein
MKRFVLGTNRTTAEQDAAFYLILQQRFSHLGWWHQLSEMWLLVDETDTLTPAGLREAAREAFPDIHLMVIEVGTGIWSGYGNKADMFPWMRETWSM